MNDLDRELALDRLEGELAPLLDAHSAAAIVAARAGTAAPPWPARLLDPQLARIGAGADDPRLAARAATLARWSLAARLAADREVRASHRAPRTLDGLAARHDGLRGAAPRLGHTVASLLAAVYGAPPARVAIVEAPDDDSPAEPPRLDHAALLTALARHAGTDPARVAVLSPGATWTTITASHRVACLLGGPVDSDATLALAAHELGHGVYAAGFAALPLGLAAPPSRVFDEAVAAWAVRAAAPTRAARGAVLHARLARFEARALAGEPVAAAFTDELGARDPAHLAVLFDEPGVAIAYALADLLALAPPPGALARWAARGAAFTF